MYKYLPVLLIWGTELDLTLFYYFTVTNLSLSLSPLALAVLLCNHFWDFSSPPRSCLNVSDTCLVFLGYYNSNQVFKF